MNVSPEVLEGVDADDRVEFVIPEWEVPHVGVHRRHGTLDPCHAKNLVYLFRIDPQVARGHGHRALASEEHRGRAATRSQIENPHPRPQPERRKDLF